MKSEWWIGILIFLLPFELMAQGTDRLSDALAIKLGTMNYKTEGADPLTSKESGFISVEYSHYWTKNFASQFAFRTVDKSSVKRNLYQASLFGVRVYPYTLGIPSDGVLEKNSISLDAMIKPYVEVGATLGRYLIRVAGNPAVLDASSQFIGLIFALGSHVQISRQYAFDLSVSYERDLGYGSPLALKATNIIGLAGFIRFF